MTCPDCKGNGCKTCGGDGTVPGGLADSQVNGEAAAKTWRR